MTELEARIALNMIPGLGPIRLKQLLAAFGTAGTILQASEGELKRVHQIGMDVAQSIHQWQSIIDLHKELDRIKADGTTMLTWDSEDYPPLLLTIPDPPMVLYVMGNLNAKDEKGIGIVGTRKASTYGLESAKKLSYQLAYAGLTVFSGLARGIDTVAHIAALAAKGRTVAILGSGLRRLYPRENRVLAERIADHGAVLSEYPMECPADRRTFPMRNRIIAGATFGTLVIEAGYKSGAIITASQAADFGRNIYAVPGRIDRPDTMGGNRLIQQGAKLVISSQDILDDLGLLFKEVPERATPKPTLNTSESIIFDAILDEPTHIDDIIRRSSLSPSHVTATLFKLELLKVLKQLPGQHYVKTL